MQLRNLIDRRNVKGGTDVKNQVNEVEDFLELVITCHLLAAAMHFFSMESTEDTPHSSGFPTEIREADKYQRKRVFQKRMSQIIDKYVVLPQLKGHQPAGDNLDNNPHIRRIQSEHQYCAPDQQTVRHRTLPQSVSVLAPRHLVGHSVRKAAPDGVFDYASALLNDGLLLLEFRDAIREGDGNRILRCWRAMTLYFRYAGHINYLSEAVTMLSLVNATASSRISSQITWGRVVNTRGGAGHNIPVDLHMEHLNRTVKDYVGNLSANISESTILQCGRSLNGIQNVCSRFDQEAAVRPASIAHTRASTREDEKRIMKELTETSNVFDYIPGHHHKTFKNVKPNVADHINKKAFLECLQQKKKDLASNQTLLKLYKHKV